MALPWDLPLALWLRSPGSVSAVRLLGPKANAGPRRVFWLAALATAILGTQLAVAQGLISFADHRFLSPDLPWLAIVAGGLMFGAGMVLTRGCVSRLTVLTGSGNLRAALVLVVFAVIAHATLKGRVGPPAHRTWLRDLTALERRAARSGPDLDRPVGRRRSACGVAVVRQRPRPDPRCFDRAFDPRRVDWHRLCPVGRIRPDCYGKPVLHLLLC